jgi:hypothetical protein
VCQLSRYGATKQLLHTGPETAAAAAYDDHFRIEDFGEPSEGMSDVPG